MSTQESKTNYIQQIRKEHDQFLNRFQTLTEKVGERENNPADLKSKYDKLKEKIEQLDWKIDNFADSQLALDDQVKKSFDDLFDELNWRYKAVEAALKGKEIWESEDIKKRGKKAISALKPEG